MNIPVDAIDIEVARPVPRTPSHPTHKLKMLLKREFWEHKGGFLWAPFWACVGSLLVTFMALVVGEVAARRAIGAGKLDGGNLTADGIHINGLDLRAITSDMDAEAMRNLAGGIDISMLMSSFWPLIVLGFVVFFYCLGCLYDERKDRSVLFWKSLPVSDRDTVLSKAVSALLVAPTLGVAAAIACMFGFLVLISLFVMLHHGNPFTLIWGPGNPLKVAASMVALIPVYALWALPTVGWLMLCSAWSRSKPFLWAILLPVFAGIVVGWFGLMNVFALDTGWFWRNIVFRGLLSVVPGSWYANDALRDGVGRVNDPGDLVDMIHVGHSWAIFGSAELWIGAIAGIAMIAAAIRLRRWRDDN